MYQSGHAFMIIKKDVCIGIFIVLEKESWHWLSMSGKIQNIYLVLQKFPLPRKDHKELNSHGREAKARCYEVVTVNLMKIDSF